LIPRKQKIETPQDLQVMPSVTVLLRFLPKDLMVKFFSLGQKAANPRPNPPDQKYSSFTKPLINQVKNHFKLFIFQVGIVAAMSGLPTPNVQG
jgi:hypothetical protein